MYSLSPKSTTTAAFLLLVAVASTVRGQMELVPEGLLDFVPDSCTELLSGVILPCAMDNVCFALLPSQEEIDNIPSIDEVQTCADVEAGICPITSRCPVCKAQADEFFKCIIFGNNAEGNLPQNVTDLVAGCSLDCSTVATADEPSSEAPVATPAEEEATSAAPVAAADEPSSEAPVAAPVEAEEEKEGSSSSDDAAAAEEGSSSDDAASEEGSGSPSSAFSVIALALSAVVAAVASV